MFDELMASVQEMDGIAKGQAQPARCFEFQTIPDWVLGALLGAEGPESEGDE